MTGKKTLFTLLALMKAAFFLSANEIVVQVSPEEKLVFEVSSEDTFIGVMNSIQYCLKDTQNNDFPFETPIQMELVFKNAGFQAKVTKQPKQKEPRNYHAELTQQEKDDISFILQTIAKNNVIKIASLRKSIKKAGDRIDRIHPFKFLMHIFTNEKLKVCIRNLQKDCQSDLTKRWVWNDFVKGIVGSLKDEHELENIREHIADFAKAVKIDQKDILPHLQNQKWHEFVNTLVNKVPREEVPNRYDI